MRFQDAARDGRSIVYAGVQADPLVARAASLLADAPTAARVLARAVMNGETSDQEGWRTAFPGLFRPAVDSDRRGQAEAVLQVALAVADRGDEVRSQLRGAIVEALTAALLARRAQPGQVRRERRVLFDGVRAAIHPFDVTVEAAGGWEVWDCKWGARGISADVLLQLDAARTNAAAEGARLTVGLVVFDARRSCLVRVARETAPRAATRLVTIEALDRLADGLAARPA
jgi:hypothetical protein